MNRAKGAETGPESRARDRHAYQDRYRDNFSARERRDYSISQKADSSQRGKSRSSKTTEASGARDPPPKRDNRRHPHQASPKSRKNKKKDEKRVPLRRIGAIFRLVGAIFKFLETWEKGEK